MAGRPGKKSQPPPKPAIDEFADDVEGFEEELPAVDAEGNPIPGTRTRDWRDVEKYRELRELKKLVGEDFDHLFDDELSLPSAKPRSRSKSKSKR
jgi:hypothetical protein